MEQNTRQQKVGRVIQKELGEILQFEMKEKFPGMMITVTKVQVTKDLSIARAFLSLFGVKDKSAALDQVRQHAGELRYRLGNRIAKQLRIVPQLEIFEDDSLDYIENIERLLDDDE
jgi:ribosome-binding factor A